MPLSKKETSILIEVVFSILFGIHFPAAFLRKSREII